MQGGLLRRVAAAALDARARAGVPFAPKSSLWIQQSNHQCSRGLAGASCTGAEAQGAAASADTALSSGEAALEQSEDPEHYKLMKSLLYRSQQRGFLELDLLIGMWAQRNVPAMSISQLQSLSEILNEENPDLFKWLTGQAPPSSMMGSNPVFTAMREDIGRELQKTRPQVSATPPGKTWLRGWDDWKKEPLTPPTDGDVSTDNPSPT